MTYGAIALDKAAVIKSFSRHKINADSDEYATLYKLFYDITGKNTDVMMLPADDDFYKRIDSLIENIKNDLSKRSIEEIRKN